MMRMWSGVERGRRDDALPLSEATATATAAATAAAAAMRWWKGVCNNDNLRPDMMYELLLS